MRLPPRWLIAGLLTLALVMGGACGEELEEIIESARACAEGDTCILAGSGQCTCPTPINSNSAERVAEAVEDHDCEGLAVDCRARSNPRCEQGRCVAD